VHKHIGINSLCTDVIPHYVGQSLGQVLHIATSTRPIPISIAIIKYGDYKYEHTRGDLTKILCG
jgi:hypothetical protein